jgi:FkbM family methyltransferase
LTHKTVVASRLLRVVAVGDLTVRFAGRQYGWRVVSMARRMASKLVPVGLAEASQRYSHLCDLGVRPACARRGAVSRFYKGTRFELLPPGALHNPDLIVDVGANLGDWSATMLSVAEPARLIAIEPQADLGLQERLRAWPTASVEQVAVGAVDGEVDFNLTEHPAAASVLKPVEGIDERYGGGMQVATTTNVPLRRLDSLVDGPVDLLKLDVQGYENAVLDGATAVLETTALLLIEITFRPHYEGDMTFPAMHRRLEADGFELLSMSEPFIRGGLAMWADALYRHAP